jgi:arylformamidase
MTQEFFDISLPLTESTIIYPNNPPVQIEVVPGASTTHSNISFGTHTGTHVDAPRHVWAERAGIEGFALSQFIGPATVIDCTQAGESVTIADLEKATIAKGARVLLKTRNSTRGYETFYDDYVYLDGDAAQWLAEREVSLVGIDYLSIKKRGGTDHRPHTVLLEHNIVILEGVDLSKVEPGEYTLMCLPLSFPHLDGAPARAVLVR